VAAPVGLVVVHDGRVAVLDPAAWCLEDLAGERAERDRDVTGAVIPCASPHHPPGRRSP
jgi:hypothetical protein